jgi:hypothetical protein
MQIFMDGVLVDEKGAIVRRIVPARFLHGNLVDRTATDIDMFAAL